MDFEIRYQIPSKFFLLPPSAFHILYRLAPPEALSDSMMSQHLDILVQKRMWHQVKKILARFPKALSNSFLNLGMHILESNSSPEYRSKNDNLFGYDDTAREDDLWRERRLKEITRWRPGPKRFDLINHFVKLGALNLETLFDGYTIPIDYADFLKGLFEENLIPIRRNHIDAMYRCNDMRLAPLMETVVSIFGRDDIQPKQNFDFTVIPPQWPDNEGFFHWLVKKDYLILTRNLVSELFYAGIFSSAALLSFFPDKCPPLHPDDFLSNPNVFLTFLKKGAISVSKEWIPRLFDWDNLDAEFIIDVIRTANIQWDPELLVVRSRIFEKSFLLKVIGLAIAGYDPPGELLFEMIPCHGVDPHFAEFFVIQRPDLYQSPRFTLAAAEHSFFHFVQRALKKFPVSQEVAHTLIAKFFGDDNIEAAVLVCPEHLSTFYASLTPEKQRAFRMDYQKGGLANLKALDKYGMPLYSDELAPKTTDYPSWIPSDHEGDLEGVVEGSETKWSNGDHDGNRRRSPNELGFVSAPFSPPISLRFNFPRESSSSSFDQVASALSATSTPSPSSPPIDFSARHIFEQTPAPPAPSFYFGDGPSSPKPSSFNFGSGDSDSPRQKTFFDSGFGGVSSKGNDFHGEYRDDFDFRNPVQVTPLTVDFGNGPMVVSSHASSPQTKSGFDFSGGVASPSPPSPQAKSTFDFGGTSSGLDFGSASPTSSSQPIPPFQFGSTSRSRTLRKDKPSPSSSSGFSVGVGSANPFSGVDFDQTATPADSSPKTTLFSFNGHKKTRRGKNYWSDLGRDESGGESYF